MVKKLIQLMPYPLYQLGGIESHVRGVTSEFNSARNLCLGVRASLVYKDLGQSWSHIDAFNIANQDGEMEDRNRRAANFQKEAANDETLRVINDADVIHVHGLERFAYLRSLREFGIRSKKVFSTHGSFWADAKHVSGLASYSRRAFDRVFSQRLLNYFGSIIVATEAEYDLTLSLLPSKFNKKNIYVLPLPIYSKPPEFNSETQMPSSGRLIALGRQDKIKNFELLARTIVANSELPPCDIFGPEGNSTQALRRILANVPADRFRIQPPIYDPEEKGRVMRQAMAVVVTSTFESFSLVAHEAIALDTPLVISDKAAYSVIRPAAEIFVSGSAESLKDALLRAIKYGRSREFREARRHMWQTYDTFSSYCQKLLTIYENTPLVNGN